MKNRPEIPEKTNKQDLILFIKHQIGLCKHPMSSLYNWFCAEEVFRTFHLFTSRQAGAAQKRDFVLLCVLELGGGNFPSWWNFSLFFFFEGKHFHEWWGCVFFCSCVIKIKIHIHHSTDCASLSLMFKVLIFTLKPRASSLSWTGAKRTTHWWRTLFNQHDEPSSSSSHQRSSRSSFLLNKHQRGKRTFSQAFKPPLDSLRPL